MRGGRWHAEERARLAQAANRPLRDGQIAALRRQTI